ncbi:MAG: regulatory signaling modulator protein AmpE [Pseudomonadales bacterium]
MEFLTILIVLGLLQLWGSGGSLQQDRWFYRFCQTVSGVIASSKPRLLILVGIPTLAVLLLQVLIDSLLFGLLSLLLYIAVLLFSLGRGDFSENIQRYLSAWIHGNFESAYERALAIGDFKQSDAISDHVSLHEHVRSAFLYAGFERWFAAIFWFLLLGPIGAIAYRLSYLCGRSEILEELDRQRALRFVHYLDWVPARLLVMSFALTGNFVNGFNRCWQVVFDNQPVAELLDQCAVAGISGVNGQRAYPADQEHFIEYGREEMLALQSLLSRSVICWLVIIAVVTVVSG